MSSLSLVNIEHASIPTPPVGKTRIAVDDTGNLVTKDSSGVVSPVGSGGGGSIKQLRTLKVSLTKEQIEQLHTNNIDILPSLPANQYYVFISQEVKVGTNNYNSNVGELGYPMIQTSYNNGVRPIYLSPTITGGYTLDNKSFIQLLDTTLLNTPIDDAEFIDNSDWTYKFDIRACKIVMSTNYYYDEVNEEIKPTQIIDLGGSTGLDIVYTYFVYDDEGNIIPYEDSVPSSSNGLITYRAKVTLTPAQLRALHTTPVEIIAAQGVGKLIVPVKTIWIWDFAVEYYTYTGENMPFIYLGYQGDETYNGFSGSVYLQEPGSQTVASTSADYTQSTPNSISNLTNKAVQTIISEGAITNDDAEGTLTIIVYYSVIDLT